MAEKEVIVTSDAGVHARPAMMLVKEATKYPCQISLINDDMEADCKSIMSVLGLAIVSGTRLIVRADGEQDEEAVNSLVSMIESNFNPGEK
ncbi:MAG: HPr family phosphocarrier protein [bacterium]|nr:HPr family phosphocarrier protein [bacterium]